MLGVPGLDPLGLVHAGFGLLALAFGLVVLVQRKGTRRHRRWGYAYVASMLLLNATALLIYDLYGRFGPFHAAALFSLATVTAATIPAVRRRPPGGWLEWHAVLMCWSFVGLVAAFLAEIAVRVPGVGVARSAWAGVALAIPVGAFLIHTRVPLVIGRIRERHELPT